MSAPEPVPVDISSSEEDDLVCVSMKKRSMHEDDDDEVVIIDKTECIVSFSQRRPRKRSQRLETIAPDDDGDCCVLASPPSTPTVPAALTATDDVGELVVTGETGPVACRDFPHPRYLCAQFPFKTTDSANCCKQCHCYVCDILAPCKLWHAHCRANDKDEYWKNMRKARKNPGYPPKTNARPLLSDRLLPLLPPPPPVQASVSPVQTNARPPRPSPTHVNVRPQQQWTMSDYARGTVPRNGRSFQRPTGFGYLKVLTNERLLAASQPQAAVRGRPKKQNAYTNPVPHLSPACVQSVPVSQARSQASGGTAPSQAPRPVAPVSNFRSPQNKVGYRRVTVMRRGPERVPEATAEPVQAAFQPMVAHGQPFAPITRAQTGAATGTQACEASTRPQPGETSTTTQASKASRTQTGEAYTRTEADEASIRNQAREVTTKKTRSFVSSLRQHRSDRRASKQDGDGQDPVRNTSAIDPAHVDRVVRDQLTGLVPGLRHLLEGQVHEDTALRNQGDYSGETGRSQSQPNDASARQCNPGFTSQEQVMTTVPWTSTPSSESGKAASASVPAAAQVCATGASSGNDLAGPNYERCYTNMQTGELQLGITDFEYLTELEALLELGTPTAVQ